MARKWTIDEDDAILSMRESGKSIDQIAKKFNATATQIRHRIYLHRPEGEPSEQTDSVRIKQLEKRVVQLQKALEIARRPKPEMKGVSLAKRSKGDYLRVIIPDTHGCKVNVPAFSALLADLEVLKPKEVVWLGDHLDCGGFLAQHHTIGYVSETDYTFEDDVAACNTHLDAVMERCPKAVHHYLEGNHEVRVERWITTQTLANKADSNYLRKMFGPELVLNLAKRGVHWYARGKFHMGVTVPGTIKLGKCHFTHGSRTGAHAASAMLRDFGGNIVYGHTHTMDSAHSRSVHHGSIGAWCPGALCELQPMYMHTQVTRWNHGYGLQFVREDGGFLHVNVPIIEGVSYLVPLTSAIG